ncbi:MAG: hypothetical protein AB7N91_31790, partial [Candidatus Tectimicrobiota bacterium]
RLPPTLVKGKSAPVTVYSIRAIYDRFHDHWAMALPCRILDAQGAGIGQGIIVGSLSSAPGQQLLFHTTMPLKIGTSLLLQPVMPEYHEVLLLTTSVESCTLTGNDGVWAYSQARLAVTETKNVGDFLTPGSCLITAEHWHPKRL